MANKNGEQHNPMRLALFERAGKTIQLGALGIDVNSVLPNPYKRPREAQMIDHQPVTHSCALSKNFSRGLSLQQTNQAADQYL